MPGLADRLTGALRRFQLPLLAGAGALAAYSAYSNAQRQRAAVVAASAVNAGQPLTPEQTAALLTQGAGLAVGAQTPLVGLAQGGLDAASALGTGAQGLAALAVGNLGGAISTIGDLAGTVVGNLPAFSPPAGLPAQPVVAPPPQPGGGEQPAPTPPAAEIKLSYYRVAFPAGAYTLYDLKGGSRSVSVGSRVAASAQRVVRSGSPSLAWRLTSGSWNGWHVVPGRSGPFIVYALYALATKPGTITRAVEIGQTGS